MSENYSTNGNGGQHNEYIYHGSRECHEHLWYNPTTGTMGAHGENTSAEDKKWAGQRAGDLHIGR